MKCLEVILVISIISGSVYKTSCNLSQNEENIADNDPYLEDILLGIYKDDDPHLLDPNDMLAPPKMRETLIDIKDKYVDADKTEGGCSYEHLKLKSCKSQLAGCSSEISELQSKLKSEKDVLQNMRHILEKANKIDVQEFYSRILRQFWSLIQMETAEDLLKNNANAVIRRLVVKVTAADVAAFRNFFTDQNTFTEVDSFFTNQFEVDAIGPAQSLLNMSREKLINISSLFTSFETWLYLLWALMFFVAIWAFCLFILDIQRELRWQRVLFMMLVLVFLISCVFHWRHMIKVRESQRHSYLIKKGLDQEKECDIDDSLWTRVRVLFLGGQSKCEKYYEAVMVTPSEEISPMMVVSETISSFFLHPLKDTGRHFGLFFSNFYQNVDLLYLIPATILLLIMFTILTLAFFGYGINFPFWLGGIRPLASNDSPQKIKQMIKESEDHMKSVNKRLMEEAKEMLSQISLAAIEHAQHSTRNNSPFLEPILHNSSLAIEKKLEHLIDLKLNSLLTAPVDQNRFAYQPPSTAVNQNRLSLNRSQATAMSTSEMCQAKDKVDGKWGTATWGKWDTGTESTWNTGTEKYLVEYREPNKTRERLQKSNDSFKEHCDISECCLNESSDCSKPFSAEEVSLSDSKFMERVKEVFEGSLSEEELVSSYDTPNSDSQLL